MLAGYDLCHDFLRLFKNTDSMHRMRPAEINRWVPGSKPTREDSARGSSAVGRNWRLHKLSILMVDMTALNVPGVCVYVCVCMREPGCSLAFS